MRILFITTGFAPYEFSENIVNSKLVLSFLEKGWEVDVISRRDEGETYASQWTDPWSGLREHVIEVIYPTNKRIRFYTDLIKGYFSFGALVYGIRWGLNAWSRLSVIMNNTTYDIVITRSPDDIAHLVGLKIKRKYGIPWIANWNDPASTIWPLPYKNIKNPLLRFYHNKLVRQTLRKADLNTFPSEELKDHFLSHFPSAGAARTSIIPHIALTESLVPENPRNERNDIFRICHAGNLSAERDPESLLRALVKFGERIGQTKYTIDIQGVCNPKVLADISELGLTSNIRILGNTSFFKAFAGLYRYDLLLVVEAPAETGIFFPSKLVDYLQSGRPVLSVSPARGFMERTLNRESGGGVAVRLDDPDDILNGLMQCYANWKSGNSVFAERVQNHYLRYRSDNVLMQYQEIFGVVTKKPALL